MSRDRKCGSARTLSRAGIDLSAALHMPMKPPPGRPAIGRRASMTTILILLALALALWLVICVAAIALASTAARGDASAAPEREPRFERAPDVRPPSRNPG
jgi:hypothetical protein